MPNGLGSGISSTSWKSRARADTVRRKSRHHRGAEERTSGGSCAGGRREAQSPRRPESAQLDAQRRLFEGCAGAWRRRHCQRNPELPLIGIRDDGQAEPPRRRAATPPPCRPGRKPRSALAPTVLNRRPSHGGPRVRIRLPPAGSQCEPKTRYCDGRARLSLAASPAARRRSVGPRSRQPDPALLSYRPRRAIPR
jgi:hypothetical protein